MASMRSCEFGDGWLLFDSFVVAEGVARDFSLGLVV